MLLRCNGVQPMNIANALTAPVKGCIPLFAANNVRGTPSTSFKST
jgi:hypothetical protein